jgi:hypothetical protein
MKNFKVVQAIPGPDNSLRMNFHFKRGLEAVKFMLTRKNSTVLYKHTEKRKNQYKLIWDNSK